MRPDYFSMNEIKARLKEKKHRPRNHGGKETFNSRGGSFIANYLNSAGCNECVLTCADVR